MNTKTITLIATLLFAAVSCTKNMQGDGAACQDAGSLRVDFSGADTRVYVDGVKTLLHSEDIFSVFHRSSTNEQWIYTGEDGSTDGFLTPNGEFTRTEDMWEVVSVYPWCETAAISQGVVSTELPDVQYFAKGTYGRGAAVLAASTTSGTLHFRYASGFACLSLTGNADIEEIALRSRGGEKIAGKCSIDMSGGRPHLTASGSSEIVMRNLDHSAIAVEGEENFLFSMAPGKYSEGIEFCITYTTGQKQTVKATGPVTINPGEVSAPVAAPCQSLFTLEANFYTDGQSAVNPFSTTIGRDMVPGTTGATSESSDVFLSSDPQHKYPFRFYIGIKDSADNLRITKSGLNFGGKIGDYIRFPGIEGMVLTAVRIVMSKDSIAGIENQDNVNIPAGAPVTLSVSEPQDGKAYRLILHNDFTVRIHNITLYYDTAL